MEPVELREQQRLVVHQLALRFPVGRGLQLLQGQVQDPRLAGQQLGVHRHPVLNVLQEVLFLILAGQQPVGSDRVPGGLDGFGIGLFCDLVILAWLLRKTASGAIDRERG